MELSITPEFILAVAVLLGIIKEIIRKCGSLYIRDMSEIIGL
jgi:hypothetical protein